MRVTVQQKIYGRLGVAAAITIATLALCASNCHAQSPWKLVWSDEFNGPAGTPPDPANWVVESGQGKLIGGNDEAEVYCVFGSDQAPCKANQPNIYLDGHGHLVIVAVATDLTSPTPHGTSPVYTSARMHSLKDFKYGRIEASLRVPSGAGVWPAFWALGKPANGLTWPAVGEVDIAESWNPQPGTDIIDPRVNHASVHGPIEPGSKEGFTDVIDDYTFAQPMPQAYHQFAAEWSPGEVLFYCDGVLYSRQSVASLTGKQVWEQDNQPFFVLLNLAMGGSFFGYPNATTPKNPTLVADYIRVYQRDESLLPSGWGNADIGGPAIAGSARNANGVWSVAGSGVGIAGRVDQFHFAYKAMASDGEVSAHVIDQTSKNPQAKAGIMLRDGRGSGAVYALLFLSPDGSLHFRARGNINDVPGESPVKGTATWLKIGRNGDLFTGSISADGKTWTTVGQAKVAMHHDILAGLIATARDNATPNIVRFDYVDVTKTDAAWDGAAATIPGTIQAEEFDTGGEGYSYAATMKHKATTPFRASEGPDVRAITTKPEPNVVPGGYYLTGLRKDDYLNYSVQVAKEGDYIFHIRAASAGAGGAIHFNLDQKPVTKSIALPDTGGAETWRDIPTSFVHLSAGQHTLALVVDAAGPSGTAANIDFIKITTP